MLSLTARGLTTGEVAAHFAEVYGATVSRDTISRITDTVLKQMAAWQARPPGRGYPVVFTDAIVVKVSGGQVTNRPIYVAIGVTVNGDRDILGSGDPQERAAVSWEYGAGDGHEGAKFWLAVSRKDWDALGKQLRPVYTAPSAAAAAERFDEFAGTWGSRYPALRGTQR